MESHEEHEAKFEVEPDMALPDLVGVGSVAAVIERPQLQLAATYLDTAGLRLLRRGVTLRHRRDQTGAENQ